MVITTRRLALALLIVMVALGAAFLEWRRVSWQANRRYAAIVILKDSLWLYHHEKGGYPVTPPDFVHDVGPLLPPQAGLKLSLLHDGTLLLESPDHLFEIEYHYISPDTMPTLRWRFR